jgi:hypothetical protein
MTQLLSAIGADFAWIEATSIARYVAESSMLTASLSALHLLGFTLVMGGALIADLRLLGVIFTQRSISDVTLPVGRGILLGLAISVITGALLFLGRAMEVSANGTFQIKMLLLVAAAVFHFSVASRASVGARRARVAGAVSLALWIGLAIAGCAFILLE